MEKKWAISILRSLFSVFAVILLGFIVLRIFGYMPNIEFMIPYRLKHILPILAILFGVLYADFNRHEHELNYIFEVIGIFLLAGFIGFGLMNFNDNTSISSDEYMVYITCSNNEKICEYFVEENELLSRKVAVSAKYNKDDQLEYHITGDELVIVIITNRGSDFVHKYSLE